MMTRADRLGRLARVRGLERTGAMRDLAAAVRAHDEVRALIGRVAAMIADNPPPTGAVDAALLAGRDAARVRLDRVADALAERDLRATRQCSDASRAMFLAQTRARVTEQAAMLAVRAVATIAEARALESAPQLARGLQQHERGGGRAGRRREGEPC